MYCMFKVQVYSWLIDMFACMTSPLLDIMTRVGKDGDTDGQADGGQKLPKGEADPGVVDGVASHPGSFPYL